ncbi:hypothetical protein [Aliiroseovarius sp. S253]|uniref:hypothetical protein n=1 Tax=Aliiroseovarius sp. S253 TaxID=3415133 RepID=UPI003C7A7F11
MSRMRFVQRVVFGICKVEIGRKLAKYRAGNDLALQFFVRILSILDFEPAQKSVLLKSRWSMFSFRASSGGATKTRRKGRKAAEQGRICVS